MMTCTLNGGPDLPADARDMEAARRMPGRPVPPGHKFPGNSGLSGQCPNIGCFLVG